MKAIVLVLLCVVVVNARWSLNYGSKADTVEYDDGDLDWFENAVFYQIYPKSWKDSTGNGVGDLQGIISKLDHLKDLGVTGAWLSPIFKSPMKDGGYDIANFREVNELFGSNDDLKDLFKKAEELGLKIILDFVPNHTSNEHEWFIKSQNNETDYVDYYVWRNCEIVEEEDGKITITKYPNNWIAVFHTPAWSYDKIRGQCYLHQFAPAQPDLNYRNKAVVEEMKNILKFWLEQGVDGFRIDAINHMFETEGLPDEAYIDINGDKTSYTNLNHIHTMNLQESYDFIYECREILDNYTKTADKKHTRLMMTEAYADLDQTLKWYGEEKKRGSHIPFNFALIAGLDRESKASDFKEAVDSWLDNMPGFARANWVLGNHDRPRIGFRYGENRHESLAIMTMTLPGINIVYYGEEILMTDNRAITWEQTDDPAACQTNMSVYQEHTRDPVRTPFQWSAEVNAGFSVATNGTWLPIHENFKTVNLEVEKASEKSTYKLYQDLIKLRDYDVLKIGSFASKALSDELFGYVRTLAGHHTIAVFINLGGAKTANLKDLMEEGDISDKTKAQILIVNNNSPLSKGSWIGDIEKIALGEYDAVIIEVSSAKTITVSLVLIAVSFFKLFL